MFRHLASFILIFILFMSTAALADDPAGRKAPDFTLKDLKGQRVSLSALIAEGPVLLDFWATWCGPCKQAMPLLAEIYEKYSDDGFTLVAISVDNTRSLSKVRPYIRSQGFSFPVLLDTDGEVLKRYRGSNVPHTVLVASDGTIRKVWIGYHPGEEEEIEAEVELLVSNRQDD